MNKRRQMQGEAAGGRELLTQLPADWSEPTMEIAGVMAGAGHRVWIVGGGVRDLLLGRPIKDVDLVSAALPDEVEALFPSTVAVGKAFGIVVVVLGGKEVELATFREERGYSDRRRPDEIRYADSPEIDARRRDFTCNALYLDPFTGEIADPTGGLGDLRAGVLRAVGDAEARFREDGLRLLRAGRFLAALDLQPAEGLLGAIRAERRSIEGVSPERVLDEVSKILRGPRPERALRVLAEGGVLELALPGWPLDSTEGDEPAWARVLAEALSTRQSSVDPGASTALGLGLAALLAPLGEMGAKERLEELRASRDLRAEVVSLIGLADALRSMAERGEGAGAGLDPVASGARVALVRDPLFQGGAALATALDGGSGRVAPAVEGWMAAADDAPREPVPVTAQDVMDAGLPPGPALGAVLKEAQHAALGGAFADREGALAWIRARVSP